MKQQQTIHSYPGQSYGDEIPVQKSHKPAPPLPLTGKYSQAELINHCRRQLFPANPTSQPITISCQCSGSGHQ
jgi:hypothetical protein